MNQAEYPQQSNQKPGLGFPIARLVGLLCAATGAVLDAAMGPYSGKTGSEHALFRQRLGSISANDLILADRYYCAYFVIALIQAQGADVLPRLLSFKHCLQLWLAWSHDGPPDFDEAHRASCMA